MFFFDKDYCYLPLEFGILFSSRAKWLIMWGWLEYSCLHWRVNKLHILFQVFDFFIYEAHFGHLR